MGVWQGAAMDSLKYHYGPPCPTLLRPVGRPSLKRPYGCFIDTTRRRPMAGIACLDNIHVRLHGRMARGGHGLSKVLFGSAMPFFYPCEAGHP
jgi:hypothetical protein